MAFTFKHGDRPLDGYTIQRAVGRGGFGEVYYAISDGGREVALKYLRDNPQVELRGVSNCINLKSPYLVSIFDVKKTNQGDFMIIMEYCSGPSLRDLMLAEPNGFPPEKAAFFAREIAKGLAYLHDRGIVHRDLKPGNIFFDDGYVKIGDYGLSKFISVSRHSAQTVSVGTVHYMAPEIGSGDYSRGVDIYALGVILYEMLRGRVPFEGSSMAEILMKHLTSQPELESLPQPFAKVVRRALEKDPRNRFQSVNEMMDELLSTDQIQQSVAGFSVQSLAGAVRHGAGGGPDSPMPSPNPAPRLGAGPGRGRPGGWNMDAGAPLPPKLAKKLDKLERKLGQKLGKLGKKTGTRMHVDREAVTLPLRGFPVQARNLGERHKRIVLACFLATCLAVALGIVFGNSIQPEAGIAAGLLVPAMSGGVALSRKAVRWFGADMGPDWASHLIRIGCCAPIMALANIPLFVESRHGLTIYLGLLMVAVFANWEKSFGRAVMGDMSLGQALWTGFGAVVSTSIAGWMVGEGEPGQFIFMCFAVAGVVSLVLQASSWWTFAERGTDAAGSGNRGQVEPQGIAGPIVAADRTNSPPHAVDSGWPGDRGAANVARHGTGSAVALPQTVAGYPGSYIPTRWAFTRMFFALAAFLLMGGTIVTILVASILNTLEPDELTGCIVGSIACGSLFLFAIRKTTPMKRPGFWRETLRPLFMSTGLFGVGAILTVMIRHWPEYGNDERILCLVGMVFSGMLLIVTVWPRRRRPPVTEPFFRATDSGSGHVQEIVVAAAEKDA